ncbi:aldehyde dehydrogenase family protein [Sporosarcina saromensis]|uniref:Aldehyde dehydrogenase family protein n=1 Tax=Sporosarcina saromensis TaxID=359365 RepID=A0ABU4GEM6_9BACL|nr:aldehyde dehydrogenase family protein [Sporosarcina saromensis]MDW0114842.1 aldehyde dehydrogenase family protein [Sporosarcina saromensis]
METKVYGKPMYVAGRWVEKEAVIEVKNPQDGSFIAHVPAATENDVLMTIKEAESGAKTAASMPVHVRMAVLHKAADYIEKHRDTFATTIALEGSKTIREANGEVTRCIQTLRLSAEEARRIKGETIPFDQTESGENRIGYYTKFPIGLIAAITPFNDPLNLVAHKVGPAIASGNAIIVKPATATPLSALLLAEAFDNAGLPPKVLSVITGNGRIIGDLLVSHPAIRMVSFTGGLETGEEIAKKAGLKKLSMELGSNSPVIVMKDADMNEAVECTVAGAFSAAGQNCLGVQRIYIEQEVFEQFTTQFVQRTRQYNVGDKLSASTDMGPLISEKEAIRVESWVQEAVLEGAELLVGGVRTGAFYSPTVLVNVPMHCTIAQQEIFGPVVLLYPVNRLEMAIELANNVNYGLQAGIFTANIENAFKAIQGLEVGGILINDSSDFRIDGMPFGGVKGSGLGREGVKFAIEEMTETKVVSFKLGSLKG